LLLILLSPDDAWRTLTLMAKSFGICSIGNLERSQATGSFVASAEAGECPWSAALKENWHKGAGVR